MIKGGELFIPPRNLEMRRFLGKDKQTEFLVKSDFFNMVNTTVGELLLPLSGGGACENRGNAPPPLRGGGSEFRLG